MAFGLLLGGCAQTVSSSPEPVAASTPYRPQLEALGGFFEPPFKLGASQSRIVIYQTGADKFSGATGIFVDGTYHASVTHGAWSQLCYRPGEVKLGARQMRVGTEAKDLLDSITALRLVGGQNHFLRVIQENGRPVLKPVSQVQALRDLEGARQQTHTISRVAQVCSRAADAPESVTPSPAVDRLVVQVLFEFDKSNLQDITPASLQQLDAQLMLWRNGLVRPQQVHVVGHADPLGQPAQNERLAQRRAETVRDYLQARLPEGVQITTESRGAKEPLVSQCDKTLNKNSIVCNALNRRVVVEMLGASR